MITALSIGRGGLGRFGNTCFTIAGVIGTAVKSGQPYGFDRWKTYDNAMFGDPVDDIESLLVKELPRIPYGLNFQDYPYFWDYRDLNLPTGSWDIHAHLQDERYFKHCMPLIRDTFRFKDEPEQNKWTAIHLRCGDYIHDPNAYHPVQEFEYYAKACELLAGEKFVVFSDDYQKGHSLAETLAFMYNVQVAIQPESSYIDDFKAMKRCKSFITANSSFSLFAAILGEHHEKKIVCPKKWFGKAADISFNGYPEGAIII